MPRGKRNDNNPAPSEPTEPTGTIADSGNGSGISGSSGDGNNRVTESDGADFAGLFDSTIAQQFAESSTESTDTDRQSERTDDSDADGNRSDRGRAGRERSSDSGRNRGRNSRRAATEQETVASKSPRAVNLKKLFDETFKLNPKQTEEIIKGFIETAYSLPAGWYGEHWKLSKVEAEDITKSVLLCLATLPKGTAKQLLLLFEKYFPWVGLCGVLYMTTYPRILITRMMIENAKRQQSGVSSNERTTNNVGAVHSSVNIGSNESSENGANGIADIPKAPLIDLFDKLN
jgi:hypothetical protein